MSCATYRLGIAYSGSIVGRAGGIVQLTRDGAKHNGAVPRASIISSNQVGSAPFFALRPARSMPSMLCGVGCRVSMSRNCIRRCRAKVLDLSAASCYGVSVALRYAVPHPLPTEPVMCIVLSNIKPINTLARQLTIINEEVAQLASDCEYDEMLQQEDWENMEQLRLARAYRDMLRDLRMGLIRARVLFFVHQQ